MFAGENCAPSASTGSPRFRHHALRHLDLAAPGNPVHEVAEYLGDDACTILADAESFGQDRGHLGVTQRGPSLER
ncbi:MAG: hypothetical protein JWQ39_439 [Glaciihabitans sp.]|nr:hypothetical protein [Glaciihabitans sp.]